MNSGEDKQAEKHPILQLDTFAIVATILGFIVDSIAIISILSSKRQNEESTSALSQIGFTPLHTLGLWILAVFTYIGFLHLFWRKRQDNDEFEGEFVRFIVRDLLLGFRCPFLLLPVVVSAILLVWIGIDLALFMGASSTQEAITQVLCVIPVVGVLLAFTIGIFFIIPIGDAMEERERNEKLSKLQQDVENEWRKWEKRVDIELSRHSWVGVDSFQDLAEVWSVAVNDLSLVLAKYAAVHPDRVIYAEVNRLEDGMPLSRGKALIQQAKFSYDKYYHT